MNTERKKAVQAAVVSNEIKETEIWDPAKMDLLKKFILTESQKQSPERKLRNQLLSIQYQMEDYIEKEAIEKEMQLMDFVRLYLKTLKFTQKELASIFEMKDSNLYKYLIGERKLNLDVVLKLSSFSHTRPELWYNIQIKNELYELNKEKEKLKNYEKYKYENFVSATG